jgi:hypothetical protein
MMKSISAAIRRAWAGLVKALGGGGPGAPPPPKAQDKKQDPPKHWTDWL